MPEYTVEELAAAVGGEVAGEGGTVIRGVNGITEAAPDEVTFVANPKYRAALKSTRAGAVVVVPDTEAPSLTLIKVANPYAAFARLLGMFAPPAEVPEGISELACIHETARLGAEVAVGPFATIREGAAVGDRTTLGAGTYVGRDTVVGADCLIYPLVTIRERVTVGDRCIVHSGTVIGSDGFGFATEGKVHHKIPQIGVVVIEDDVEIGANCTIDRATMGETRLGRGAKLDNLIQIAHNVKIGAGTLIAAQTGIAGSTVLGEFCVLGGQVGIVPHITIGNGAILAAQSGITKSLRDGATVFGRPARPLAEVKRREGRVALLEKYFERVKALEKEVAGLKKASRTNGNGADDGD
ncbi:MAG: UDP-3-O-(3-hydroxymyristoyl)glucosamine N-acyltransferase [Candidatus Coatesbacteria bacterium]|nr:MAG: UDP-3-O-(3-hydroxymyristoyl)glucosamine N-acyltransferase [Candidatus Coatesbacteria bacterium]